MDCIIRKDKFTSQRCLKSLVNIRDEECVLRHLSFVDNQLSPFDRECYFEARIARTRLTNVTVRSDIDINQHAI